MATKTKISARQREVLEALADGEWHPEKHLPHSRWSVFRSDWTSSWIEAAGFKQMMGDEVVWFVRITEVGARALKEEQEANNGRRTAYRHSLRARRSR